MTEPNQKKMTSQASYGDRVITRVHGTGEYLLMQAPVKNVISFSGSFLNIPDFGAGQDLIRDLTISMLDKGTERRSKSELARVLEGMGALITFSSDGIRTRVSGRSMAADMPTVLNLMAEQLFSPSFPTDEFELLKGRYEASLQRNLTDTASLAGGALSRRIFGTNHPAFITDPTLDLERLAAFSVDHVREYYSEHIRTDEWKLALVGDTDFDWFDDSVAGAFDQTNGEKVDIEYPQWAAGSAEPGTEQIFVEDRENIHVYLGHEISVSPTDDAYLPLYLGNYILGGNFSARLMNVIRDELGLTYGINSSLAELDPHHSGLWKISVTLSRDAVETGIEETRKLITEFVRDGVSEDETEEKKETVAGLFQVGLSSTRSLASALVRNCEKRRTPSYLDDFPSRVGGLNTSEINSQITEHFHPDQMHITMAGTVSGPIEK